MAGHDELLELVGRCYEAALSPDLWPGTLARLADWLAPRVARAHLFYADPASGRPLFAALAPEAAQAQLRDYHDHYQRLDPRIPVGLRRPAGVLAPDGELVPPRVFEASEFYNDFYVRLGLRFMLGGFLEKGPEALIGLSFIRELRHGPFDRRDQRRLAPLLPHLHRATRIQRRLAGLDAARAGAIEALHRLALGVLLLDERGRPLFVNRAAEALLAEGDGLTAPRGRLHAATRTATTRLQGAIAAALGTRDGRGPGPDGALALPRPSGRPPLAVLVAPVGREPGGAGLDGRTAVLVLVEDPERRAAPPAEVAAALYGLTPTEARLATELAAGRSLAEIAEAAGLTRHTVRWTLKNVFAKTGARRQTDLVRRLLQGPAGLARGATDVAAGRPGVARPLRQSLSTRARTEARA